MTRTALITGAARGIGLATADALLREGWKVAISGRRADVVEEARSALGADVLAIAGTAASPTPPSGPSPEMRCTSISGASGRRMKR